MNFFAKLNRRGGVKKFWVGFSKKQIKLHLMGFGLKSGEDTRGRGGAFIRYLVLDYCFCECQANLKEKCVVFDIFTIRCCLK